MVATAIREEVQTLLSQKPENAKILDTIMNWNLDVVKQRVAKDYPDIDVEKATQEYRYFMYLACIDPSQFGPSKEMDSIWHTHILFTRDYFAFSEACYGTYIHHTPLIVKATMEQKENEFRRLCSLAMAHFGLIPFTLKEIICCSNACCCK
jgi:hypothetical protein